MVQQSSSYWEPGSGSTCANCFWTGPNSAPRNFAVTNGILFGSTSVEDFPPGAGMDRYNGIAVREFQFGTSHLRFTGGSVGHTVGTVTACAFEGRESWNHIGVSGNRAMPLYNDFQILPPPTLSATRWDGNDLYLLCSLATTQTGGVTHPSRAGHHKRPRNLKLNEYIRSMACHKSME